MFWGLIMQPNKRYTQTVEKAFHLSMACLDANTASTDLVQVMINYENHNYLLCTLKKGSIWQVPLDLNFQEGSKIALTCNGNGHVHLTGYLIPEDDGLDEMDDFDDEEEEEEEEIPQLVDIKKRKGQNLKDNLKQTKKSRMEVEEEDDDDDDDDESDDDEDGLENDDDSDDGLDEDAEEDDEDEDDSDEDENNQEVQEPVKATKKQKQKQAQQAQQAQQNHQVQNQQQNKKDKNKLVNGNNAKSEKEQGKQKKSKDDSKSDSEQQKKRTIEGGVQVEDIKVGSGQPAKSGKFVSVYYLGKLKNGKKFDATQTGEGFKFRLGKGEVIKGWDIGIAGMKVGGKRRITIPANLAYGAKGSPPVIPPNSVLDFEVELKAVH